MSTPILAAGDWPTNADLILACRELGYLDGHVLDPTYGKGNWWTLGHPSKFTAHDIANDEVDFRDLPHPDGCFDAIAFDPPYVSPGGRTTSGIKEMHAAYGMQNTPKNPRALWEDNTLGFAECVRVLKRGGTIIYKSQDYITSGKFQPVTHWIITDALEHGLEYVDRLEHVTGVRPQPSGRRQVHARRNLSTMLVFRKMRTDR